MGRELMAVRGYSTGEAPKRVKHNFNAGPSHLPKVVMERAQREFLDYQGTGIGVIEMSHRQKEFADVAEKLAQDFRTVMKVPDNFQVLFA